MKFSKKILFLLGAITTLAIDLNLNDINNKYSLTITYDENADCVTSINEYKACYGSNRKTISKDKLDEMCDIYLTDRCQKFFKDGIDKLNGCEKLSENLLFTYTLKYEEIGILFAELCSRDENNNYCPISKYLQNEFYSDPNSKTKIDNSVNETCKSQKCVEETIEFINHEIEFDKKLKEFQDKMTSAQNSKRQYDSTNVSQEEENNAILEFLNSDKCSTQVSVRSDATTRIIYSNIIFITIGVLLYALI
eukprot:jgi/Orpsp1_1/1181960/evm.model.c7180000079265.1